MHVVEGRYISKARRPPVAALVTSCQWHRYKPVAISSVDQRDWKLLVMWLHVLRLCFSKFFSHLLHDLLRFVGLDFTQMLNLSG